MPEIQKPAHLKVQSSCIVPADWVVDDGTKSGEPLARAPRKFTRKVGPRGKQQDVTFLQVGPGAKLNLAKIPAERQRKMLDKSFPVGIPIDEPIPPDPPKTAVHASAAEADKNIARVQTGKSRSKGTRRKKT